MAKICTLILSQSHEKILLRKYFEIENLSKGFDDEEEGNVWRKRLWRQDEKKKTVKERQILRTKLIDTD